MASPTPATRGIAASSASAGLCYEGDPYPPAPDATSVTPPLPDPPLEPALDVDRRRHDPKPSQSSSPRRRRLAGRRGSGGRPSASAVDGEDADDGDDDDDKDERSGLRKGVRGGGAVKRWATSLAAALAIAAVVSGAARLPDRIDADPTRFSSLIVPASASAVSAVNANANSSSSSNAAPLPLPWPPPDLLSSAADSRNRLVVVSANCDFADFADNFVRSLLKLGSTNFVIVPLDEMARRLLDESYPGHVTPVFPGVLANTNGSGSGSLSPLLSPSPIQIRSRGGGGATYGSAEFQRLTAARPEILRGFLERGHSVLYSDIDAVWRKSFWDDLDKSGESELVLYKDGPSGICSCLIYLQPTRENLGLLRDWTNEISTGKYSHDQSAFHAALRKVGIRPRLESEANLYPTGNRTRVRVEGDRDKFPHGRKYFFGNDNDTLVDPRELSDYEMACDRERTVVVHNNWIRGKDRKIRRFRRHGLWDPSEKFRDQNGHIRCQF